MSSPQLGVDDTSTDDEHTLTEPRWPIYLSGFSLGANVVLKTLGELGETAQTKYNICGGSVTGAPFDCERNIDFLEKKGFNRVVYTKNFVQSMKVKAQTQLDRVCDGDECTTEFDFDGAMAASTVAEFENAYIAKVYGYEDNVDYYRQTSCAYFLDGIAVPTLVVNAADDPFFDPDLFPWEKSCDFEGGDGNLPIKLVRTDHGGHLGYMFHQADDVDAIKQGKMRSSWMPTELARFLDYVHES